MMHRPENDPKLTELLAAFHRDYPVVDHITKTGRLNKLFDHLEGMKKKMDDIQFRINAIRFPR